MTIDVTNAIINNLGEFVYDNCVMSTPNGRGTQPECISANGTLKHSAEAVVIENEFGNFQLDFKIEASCHLTGSEVTYVSIDEIEAHLFNRDAEEVNCHYSESQIEHNLKQI